MVERRPIEIRAAADGVVAGTVVKYGDVAVVAGQRERFLPGSLALSSPKLNLHHDTALVIANSVKLTDTPDALNFEAQLEPHWAPGVQQMVASGELTGASMEFFPIQERMADGVRVVELARIAGLALVDRPAYPASAGLQMRRHEGDDSSAMGMVELRSAGVIAGAIQFGVPGITSLMRKRKLLIENGGAIRFDPNDVLLYAGFNQDNALASLAAGSLRLVRTADHLRFVMNPRKAARTTLLRETRQKIGAGLIRGAIPGIGVEDSEEYQDDDGYTVLKIHRGILCHVNLTTRSGQDYMGALSTGRPRRRSWL